MDPQYLHKKGTASTIAASVSSIIFSIIASSHHWLHTLILLVLGSSTNMMVDMSGLLWLRRAMVIATLISSIYAIYSLKKHKHMPTWMKVMNTLSVLISLGFIIKFAVKPLALAMGI
ncbi:hypothetical protein [Paenibacillus sp. GP183]|uniref:hypothetical protein n=1 Tax=Paenibacillus sp. GP183 TaxID=1882751 RepID=UPI00089CF931|nr:hypothetical protein [Paenibacillus sp. GP183]SEC05798.1 hypothetical protein SAMN05443246_2824 [Paenibacillus sp. GP183]